MPGKPTLASTLVDHAMRLRCQIDAALTDRRSPGVIDAREARCIQAQAALVHGGARVIEQAQREGLSIIRYRRSARDLAVDARDLGLPALSAD